MKFYSATLLLPIVLTACSSGNETAPVVVEGQSVDRSDEAVKASVNAPKIEQFLVNYLPPKEITDKVGATSKLTFSVKVKTNEFDGFYTFFDCVDSECSSRHKKFVIECDKNRSCQAFDDSGNRVGTPDHIWTFAYLWQAIYNPKTKKYDSWTGLDLQFVDPESLADGFHDQYYAAQFEDLNGNKSELKTFHFKK